ncbi:MAG: hypothetical protein ACE5IK_13365 [Acidobacteriota bacterium]
MRRMNLPVMGGLCLALGLVFISGCGPASDAGASDETAAATTTTEPVAAPAPVAETAPAPAPAPKPRPAPPAPRTYTLQAGTTLAVRFEEELSSEVATVGQPVAAVVSESVRVNGQTIIPSGARVEGSVVEVKPAKRFGGQATLVVQFERVLLPHGRSVDVDGQIIAQARKEAGKDAAKIGGGAAAGAFLGKVLGKGGKDTRTGAALGGAVGTALASKKGDEAFIEAGFETTVTTLSKTSVTDR